MLHLEVSIWIRAKPEICFDLARDIDTHLKSAARTGERVVAGRSSGLLELGDEITWEGKHLGVTQRLSSRITAMQPYAFFQDRMTKGAFAFLEHDHIFTASGDGTTMTDKLRFAAPFGPIGWVAERIFVGPHLRRFLTHRGNFLKQLAEAEMSRPS